MFRRRRPACGSAVAPFSEPNERVWRRLMPPDGERCRYQHADHPSKERVGTKVETQSRLTVEGYGSNGRDRQAAKGRLAARCVSRERVKAATAGEGVELTLHADRARRAIVRRKIDVVSCPGAKMCMKPLRYGANVVDPQSGVAAVQSEEKLRRGHRAREFERNDLSNRVDAAIGPAADGERELSVPRERPQCPSKHSFDGRHVRLNRVAVELSAVVAQRDPVCCGLHFRRFRNHQP